MVEYKKYATDKLEFAGMHPRAMRAQAVRYRYTIGHRSVSFRGAVGRSHDSADHVGRGYCFRPTENVRRKPTKHHSSWATDNQNRLGGVMT